MLHGHADDIISGLAFQWHLLFHPTNVITISALRTFLLVPLQNTKGFKFNQGMIGLHEIHPRSSLEQTCFLCQGSVGSTVYQVLGTS